jgi:hypothetical protein
MRLGRVRVLFDWQDSKDSGNASPWINIASPMASKDSGFMFLPAAGDAVMVDFVDGNVENPYVARAKLQNINKYLPVSVSRIEDTEEDGELFWNSVVEYEPVFRIGTDMMDSIRKMRRIDELLEEFPGLDCGSCGAPTCRAFAEDVVRGTATLDDCLVCRVLPKEGDQ